MYSLRHLTGPVLLRDCAAIASRDHGTEALLLAHIAEVEDRKEYEPAGYDSMYRFCVEALRLSEDTALLRIRVARVALEFPAIFPMLADGRLHLSAVMKLKPFLTAQNVEELLAAVAGKSKSQIDMSLAERFPKPDVPTRIQSPAAPELRQLVPEPVATKEQPPAPRTRVTPLAAERFGVQFTMGRVTHDKLRYAEALLSHQIAPGRLGEVLDRALDALIPQLEKGKFGKTDRPRRQSRASKDPRHIPAHVKRAVWERDGGQCAFVSDAGHRCSSCERLEFDHIEEVARGGKSTVSNIRLLCRTHNQYGAERTFGVGFMDEKRRKAQSAAAESREAAEARVLAEQAAKDAADALARAAAEQAAAARDVTPYLRKLKFRAEDVKRAAAYCESLPDIPLNERVRAALSFLAPNARRVSSQPGAA